MAKRINLLYRDTQQMLGKHRGYIKPRLFEDALEFASRGLFDHYYGNTEDYRVGKALPPVAYEVTQAAADALKPFLREVVYGRDPAQLAAGVVALDPDQTAPYLLLADDGRFVLPEGCVHVTSWDTDEAEEDVQTLDDNEVKTTLRSLVAPPDVQHPMIAAVQGGLRLYPAEVEELRGKYLARPRRATLVYDPAADDESEPIYNDDASVDVEWPPARDNQLLTRLLAYPALGLRDNVVQQVARELSERGK